MTPTNWTRPNAAFIVAAVVGCWWATITAPSLSVDAFHAVVVVPLLSRSPRFGRRQTASPLMQAADAWSNSATTAAAGGGGMEQVEFKIYPDGRVEETVRGVKGNNCHKVTEKINEALGQVVASQPTAEMFEQEVLVENTLYNKQETGGTSSSTGDSSWEGSSSW